MKVDVPKDKRAKLNDNGTTIIGAWMPKSMGVPDGSIQVSEDTHCGAKRSAALLNEDDQMDQNMVDAEWKSATKAAKVRVITSDKGDIKLTQCVAARDKGDGTTTSVIGAVFGGLVFASAAGKNKSSSSCDPPAADDDAASVASGFKGPGPVVRRPNKMGRNRANKGGDGDKGGEGGDPGEVDDDDDDMFDLRMVGGKAAGKGNKGSTSRNQIKASKEWDACDTLLLNIKHALNNLSSDSNIRRLTPSNSAKLHDALTEKLLPKNRVLFNPEGVADCSRGTKLLQELQNQVKPMSICKDIIHSMHSEGGPDVDSDLAATLKLAEAESMTIAKKACTMFCSRVFRTLFQQKQWDAMAVHLLDGSSSAAPLKKLIEMNVDGASARARSLTKSMLALFKDCDATDDGVADAKSTTNEAWASITGHAMYVEASFPPEFLEDMSAWNTVLSSNAKLTVEGKDKLEAAINHLAAIETSSMGRSLDQLPGPCHIMNIATLSIETFEGDKIIQDKIDTTCEAVSNIKPFTDDSLNSAAGDVVVPQLKQWTELNSCLQSVAETSQDLRDANSANIKMLQGKQSELAMALAKAGFRKFGLQNKTLMKDACASALSKDTTELFTTIQKITQASQFQAFHKVPLAKLLQAGSTGVTDSVMQTLQSLLQAISGSIHWFKAVSRGLAPDLNQPEVVSLLEFLMSAKPAEDAVAKHTFDEIACYIPDAADFKDKMLTAASNYAATCIQTHADTHIAFITAAKGKTAHVACLMPAQLGKGFMDPDKANMDANPDFFKINHVFFKGTGCNPTITTATGKTTNGLEVCILTPISFSPSHAANRLRIKVCR